MNQPINSLSFYFSFRSPYAWLAFHRLSKIAERLPVNIDYIPLFPPRQFSEATADNPQKTSYVAEDVGRFAKAYGLTLQWPEPFDTDWKGADSVEYKLYVTVGTILINLVPKLLPSPFGLNQCT
jgi:2-hydroxychromene-2-carboxylate isomerase